MPKFLKLPGLIDVHVHLREPGATKKEDFTTGTKAAIAGGFTQVLDMPNNPIPTTTPEALKEKMGLAQGKIFCDVGFHFGATPTSIKYFPQVWDQVFGLKLYMNHTTGELLIEDNDILEKIFAAWTNQKPIMVHAESQTLQKAISLAKKFDKRLHVCHVSLQEEIEAIKAARAEGVKVTCEVACHHLFLTEEDVKRLGPFGVMKPPLRGKKDQQALWQALMDGTIDMIASDHAPHTKEEKQGEKIPNGVPGLETTLPLLLTAVNDGRITFDRLVDLTYTNPQKVFNLSWQEDTYIEVDMDENWVLSNDNLQTKCQWTPFAGMKVRGRVKKVILRGQLVFDDQNFFGPYGQIINPVNN